MVEERTLKYYANPSTEEPHTIIVYPTVECDKFEIKPAFFARFFSPSRTAQLWAKLYQFTQKDGESLYDA